MGRSLEAALVFGDSAAAEDTLATLGKQGQFSQAILVDGRQKPFASWHNDGLARQDKVSDVISKWLFPEPTVQPILHQGKVIGELRLTALDRLISYFLGISIIVLTGSIFSPHALHCCLPTRCIAASWLRCEYYRGSP